MPTRSRALLRALRSRAVLFATSLGLLLLLLGPGGRVSPSEASFPGGLGKLVFAVGSIGCGDWYGGVGNSVHLINPDGSGEQTILTASAGNFSWSPNGKWIAYENGSGQIYVVEADGSNPTYFADGKWPEWSRDGTRLVFSRLVTNGWAVIAYDLNSGTETQITTPLIGPWTPGTDYPKNTADDAHHPAWQPNGDKIVFSRVRSVDFGNFITRPYVDLWTVNANGSGLTQITDVGRVNSDPDPGYDRLPDWSPDGADIAFARYEFVGTQVENRLYLVPAGGGALFPVTPTKLGDMPSAAWSPDGNKLAYVGYVAGSSVQEIRVVDADLNVQVIKSTTPNPHTCTSLSWRPIVQSHTFVVNSTDDDSDNNLGDQACDTGQKLPGGAVECTLRAAVEEANASPGQDTITFNIAGGGVPRIQFRDTHDPLSGLVITEALVIDGATQPGSGRVEVAGGHTPGSACGGWGSFPGNAGRGLIVAATGAGSTIRGLVMHDFCAYAIALYGNGTVLEGNYIGTNAAGTQGLGNGGIAITDPEGHAGWTGAGIFVESDGNRIGGTAHTAGVCDGTCNLISGNNLTTGAAGWWSLQPVGIKITGGHDNLIVGNFIGPNLAGSAVPGGARQRVGLLLDAAGLTVTGGAAPGERNLISGNEYHGIRIQYAGHNNTIRGNWIGSNAAGAGLAGGEQNGIRVDDSLDNLVVNNTFSGTDAPGNFGVGLYGSSSTGNVVRENLIGAAPNGTTPLGFHSGVLLETVKDNQVISNTLAYNRYGVNTESLSVGQNQVISNTIHHNDLGVWAWTDSRRLRISANSIHDNAALGIDLLEPDGPNPNDNGDTDTGANDLLNYPVLGFAMVTASGELRVEGSFESIAGSHPYRLEFFANAACDLSGYGEGERYLGYMDVTTDVSGRIGFEYVRTGSGVARNQFLTATAIDQNGNTSEFSRCALTQFGSIVSASASPGATVLQIADTRGFVAGSRIQINPGGANQENNRVVGLGSLLLAAPLQYSHQAGEPVVTFLNFLYLPLMMK